MRANEFKLPRTTSLAVCVSRLGPSWRFYAKLIGLELVGSVGRPVHSLFLSMPESGDKELTFHDDDHADPFMLRLTTLALPRSVSSIRIELESVDELVRIWMLSKMMRFPNSGLRVAGAAYSMIVRDPDWHPIELRATDRHSTHEPGGFSISSPGVGSSARSEPAFAGESFEGVLGGLFVADAASLPNSAAVRRPSGADRLAGLGGV